MLKDCEILSISSWAFKGRGIPGLKFTWANPSVVWVCVCVLYNNSNCMIICLFSRLSPGCTKVAIHFLSSYLIFHFTVSLEWHLICITAVSTNITVHTGSKLSHLQRRARICLCLSHVGYSRSWWDLRCNVIIMKTAGRNICSAA